MAILPSQDSLSAFTKAQDVVSKQAQQLTQAQTGKAAPVSGGQGEEATPGFGDLYEKIKQQKAQAPIQQLQLEQQQVQQAQQQAQQNTQLKEKSLSIKEKLKDDTEELLQKFEQQKDLLDLDRYKADIEQIGFNLRMQNTKYIDNLKLEGARSRFDQKERFTEALTAAVLADELDLLKNNLAFRKMMGIDELKVKGALAADERAFAKKLGDMGLETALQIALADADARNTALKYGAISDVVTTIGKTLPRMNFTATEKQEPISTGFTDRATQSSPDKTRALPTV